MSRFTASDELLCVTIFVNQENVRNIEVLARQIAIASNSNLATPLTSKSSTILQSPFSVSETITRLSDNLQKNNNKLFSDINHSKEAESAGLKLNNIQVIAFGNPLKGTKLMQENPQIALDLPLRAMAFEDRNHRVWLSYIDPVKLAKEYGIEDIESFKPMSDELLKSCQQAVGQY